MGQYINKNDSISLNLLRFYVLQYKIYNAARKNIFPIMLCYIWTHDVSTPTIFYLLETSLFLTKSKWMISIAMYNILYAFPQTWFCICLHAWFPLFRAVFHVSIVSSHVSIVCVLSSIPYNFALNGIRQSVKWTFAE